jgi:hypothetical protein
MSGRWIQDCKRILAQIKEFEEIKEQDRLDMVCRMRFILYALQRSVSGWMEWINNPDVMARFSLEELKAMSRDLTKLTHAFIEYDCEITSRAQRSITTREPEPQGEKRQKPKSKKEIFYVK